jgi:hypothetical protein
MGGSQDGAVLQQISLGRGWSTVRDDVGWCLEKSEGWHDEADVTERRMTTDDLQ